MEAYRKIVRSDKKKTNDIHKRAEYQNVHEQKNMHIQTQENKQNGLRVCYADKTIFTSYTTTPFNSIHKFNTN